MIAMSTSEVPVAGKGGGGGGRLGWTLLITDRCVPRRVLNPDLI